MSYSPITGTGIGSAPVVNITFPALAPAHVKASVGGVEVPYTWTGPSQITLSSPVPSGSQWAVYRETPTEPLVGFSNETVLTAEDMNLVQTQVLYRHQELENRVLNVGDAVAAAEEASTAAAAATAASAAAETAAAAVASRVAASDLAASSGAGMVGFKATGGNAIARNLLVKAREIVSLRDYGAALDGSTLDDAAFTKLFTDRAGGEVRVMIDGYCKISGTVAPPSGMSNVALDFGGGGYLYSPSHSFDMLHLPATVAGWELINPRFYTDAGASGATERFALRNDSNDLLAHNLWVRNCWSGVINTGSKVFMLGRSYLNGIKPGAGSAVTVDMGTNEVFMLENLLAENATGADCLSGVKVISGGSIIIGGSAPKCGTPLLVAPTAGKTVATLGLWPFFNGDTSSGHGAWFAGAGTIQRVEGVLRVSSNGGRGLLVDNSPHSADLQVRAVDNVSHGVDLASGGSQYNSRYRVMAFGNDLSGVNVEPNATDFSLDIVGGSGDDFGGNGQYSVAIGAGCDHFDVRVVGRGDTLGQIYNGTGTSATKVVTARN